MANSDWLLVARLIGLMGVRRFAGNLADLLGMVADALPSDERAVALELARAAERAADAPRAIK